MNKWIVCFAFVLFAASLLPLVRAADDSTDSSSTSSVRYIQTYNLHKSPGHSGWNLISFPFYFNGNPECKQDPCPLTGIPPYIKVIENSCGTNTLYYYDNGQYVKYEFGSYIYPMSRGYWIKVSDECKITIQGNVMMELDGMELSKGWNQIGAPYGNAKFDDVKGNCQATSGPYKFNANAYNWEKADVLQRGEGYFVKVAGNCKLGSQEPPNPPEDKQVLIEEFADFQCPYCARGHATMNQLENAYGAQIKRVFRQFPLTEIHPLAQKAAEASECARDQGRFEDYRDMLFNNQNALSIANLKSYASKLGLNRNDFDGCLDSGRKAAIIERDLQEGNNRGVHGTPAYFLSYNGNQQMLSGAQNYEAFKAAIDSLLGGVINPTVIPLKGFDLGITNLQFSNTNPKVGERVTITANLYNYGDKGGYLKGYGAVYELGNAGSSNAVPDKTSPGIYIGPKQTYQLTFTNAFQSAGNWRVKITIKPENDYNYGNNEISQSLSVGSASPEGFDPGVSDISFSNNNPKAGEAFSVKVPVVNYGNAGGYISSFSLNFAGGGEGNNVGGGFGMAESGSRYLGPGQSYTYTANSQSLPTGGYWTVTATVSGKYDINSNNNALKKQLYVSPNQNNCIKYSDGSYYSLAIGCEIISTSGHHVKIVDISAYYPQRAQLDVMDGNNVLVKRVYLGKGESTTISEANSLYIQIINTYPGAYAKTGSVDISVKSGNQQGTQFSKMFYSLHVYPQHSGSPELITLYDASRVKGTQSGNSVTATFEDWTDWDWNDLTIATSYSGNSEQEILKITLQACDTAALDKTDVTVTFASEKEIELRSAYPTAYSIKKVTGNSVFFNLWEQCQGHVGEVKEIIIKEPAVPSPSPSPSPAPFTPQAYEINIRNNYWATPNLIQLFNPSDRWRFVGTQNSANIVITGLEDSISYDRDFNDLGFEVTKISDSQYGVHLTLCDTAGFDAMHFQYKYAGTRTLSVTENNATVTGEYPEIQLWPQCQGHVGEWRTVSIS
ncbi:MAG: thioredoxin domain-containing protein [Candidatus Micrarchaeota archaeon]